MGIASIIPFKRVKETDEDVDPRLADNSFEAKVMKGCGILCTCTWDDREVVVIQ